MKRPSDLIIAFVLAIAATFFAFAIGRIALRVFLSSNEIEIEENYLDD